MVPAGGNGNRHRPRGSRAPPRPHRGPAGCYRRRKTGRPRITSPWTCAPRRTGNPRVFELHSSLSAEEFRSLRSKRCSAYARRQTATGQTTGRMRTPKHGGRRRRRAKAGRATTRGANPALHKVPNMSPASSLECGSSHRNWLGDEQQKLKERWSMWARRSGLTYPALPWVVILVVSMVYRVFVLRTKNEQVP